jgi:hypothetical protein
MKRFAFILVSICQLGCATTGAPGASASADELAAREQAHAMHGGEDGGSCKVDGADAPLATAFFFDVTISGGGEPSFGINHFGAEGEATARAEEALIDDAADLVACVDRVEDKAQLEVVRSAGGELELGEHSLPASEAECIMGRLRSGLEGIEGVRLDPLVFRFGLREGDVRPGVLQDAAISAAIDAHADEIRACYSAASAGWPGLEGQIAIELMILPSGAARSVGVADSSVGNGPLECCILHAVDGWEFPEPEGGGIVRLSYPFVVPPPSAP